MQLLTDLARTFIGDPVFNILTFILSIIPGHNFGLAIIVFALLARLALYPLLKKQLHHQKKLRDLQPEIKRIRKEAKGDKQLEMKMVTELYRDTGAKPFAPLGILLAQAPIFIAFTHSLVIIIKDPSVLYNKSYSFIQNLPYMQTLKNDVSAFDNTLLGAIDLTKAAHKGGSWIFFGGTWYLPALILVVLSVIAQVYIIRQTLPKFESKKRLRDLIREQAEGKEVDQAEMLAAQSGIMKYFMPGLIFVFTIYYASGLALYVFVGSVTQYLQQRKILNSEAMRLETEFDKAEKKTKPAKKTPKVAKKSPSKKESAPLEKKTKSGVVVRRKRL